MEEATHPLLGLEELEERITALEAQYAKSGNMWDKLSIDRLVAYRDKWYTEDGGHKPPAPPVEPVIEFSPLEVVGAVGWQNVVPTGYGDISAKYAEGDPTLGLDISVARSNGCFRIRNQFLSAQRWIEDPAGVAAHYRSKAPGVSISERLIRMAGHTFANWWIMLPTAFYTGAYTYIDDYTFEPEGASFNEAEIVTWKENINRIQLEGMGPAMVGASFASWPLKYNGERVGDRYLVSHVFNHPQWTIPALMSLFNSGNFKRQAYRAALTRAHAIDNGQREPSDGYGEWTEFASGVGSYQEFCQKFERSAQTFTPQFQATSEL
jgi:hypothetical protein